MGLVDIVSRWGHGEEGASLNLNNARWPLIMWTPLLRQSIPLQDSVPCLLVPSP
jgi:hypothetical protein